MPRLYMSEAGEQDSDKAYSGARKSLEWTKGNRDYSSLFEVFLSFWLRSLTKSGYPSCGVAWL